MGEPAVAETITREEVAKIAHLARLDLTEAELDRYTRQLGQILDYVAKLSELDTDSVEPVAHGVELANVFRADAARPGLAREDALADAPERSGEFFLVPKVFE